MKRIISLLFLIWGTNSLFAQPEPGLWFLPEVSQANQLNPAYTGSREIVVGLPLFSGSFQLQNSAFPVQQVFLESDDQLNLSDAISQLEGNQFTRLKTELQILKLAFKYKRIQIGLESNFRILGHFQYSSELAQLLWFGNAGLVGESVQVSPDFQFMAYQDWAARVSFPIGDKLRIGTRLHYLGGIADISTGKNQVTLYTDPDYYQLTFDADYELRATTGVTGWAEQVGEPNRWLSGGNQGFALDIGGQYQLMDGLEIGASLLNLGAISWQRNARTLHSEGIIQYDGLRLGFYSQDQAFTIEGFADSLESTFAPERTDEGYSTSLPARALIGVTWQAQPWLRLGANLDQEWFRGEQFSALSLHTGFHAKDFAYFGLTYTYQPQFQSQLGAQLMLRAGPAQFFVMTNNVLSVLQYQKAQTAHLRIGLNLAIGAADWTAAGN